MSVEALNGFPESALGHSWSRTRLKRLANLRAGQAITSEAIEEHGDHAVYGGGGLRGFTDRYTHSGRFALIGRQGALCGNVVFAEGKFWASEHAIVASTVPGVVPKWLYYLLIALDLNRFSVSAAQPGIAVDNIRDLVVPAPEEREQRAIADFLDRKTAAIDALIEKKERLIALLEEKRQALITQAVTKGLDPNVPMKDSGIEWLGPIPAHWEALPLRRLIQTIEQGWSPEAEDRRVEADEWGVLKLSAIRRGEYDDEAHKALPDGTQPRPEHEVRPGDVLMSRANTVDRVADVALVGSTRGRLMISDLVYRLVPRESRVQPEFLVYSLLSLPTRIQVATDARGSSMTMAKVSQGHIRSWTIGVPALEEQAKIVAAVRRDLDRIGRTRDLVLRQLRTLAEYRQALITKAVCGRLEEEN